MSTRAGGLPLGLGAALGLQALEIDVARVEVRYDHMEGNRFRHTAQFVRWRPDREARSCTFEQLEEPVSFDLAEILGIARPRDDAALRS